MTAGLHVVVVDGLGLKGPPNVHRPSYGVVPVDDARAVPSRTGRVLVMTKTYTSADDVMARVNAQAEQALEAMERAQAYRSATQLIRCRGQRDGVSVEVDAQGFLIGVEFSDGSTRLGRRQLAAALQAAYGAALDQVLDRLVREAQEAWGDSESTEAVVDDLRARFARRARGGQ